MNDALTSAGDAQLADPLRGVAARRSGGRVAQRPSAGRFRLMTAILVITGVALLRCAWHRGVAGREAAAGRVALAEPRRASGLGLAMAALGLVAAAVPLALDATGVDAVVEVCHHLLGPAAPGAAAGALRAWP